MSVLYTGSLYLAEKLGNSALIVCCENSNLKLYSVKHIELKLKSALRLPGILKNILKFKIDNVNSVTAVLYL